MAEEVKGEMGFDDSKDSKDDLISKEETMFRVGEDGKAIPEKYPVWLYDRELDMELIEEGLFESNAKFPI